MNYVVGDLHGCYTKLKKLLDRIEFNLDQDTLYCVGDLCDRGFENLKILEFVYSLENSFKPVFGNHDIWLYKYFLTGEENECWISWNGGYETFKEVKNLSNSEKKKYANWLGEFPYMIEVGNNIICHNFISKEKLKKRIGDVDPFNITLSNCFDVELVKHPDYDEYVFDRSIANYITYKSGHRNYYHGAYQEKDFNDDFLNDKNYIMGHTPLYNKGMAIYKGVYMIDTGAFVTKEEYGTDNDGHMTLMEVESKKVWIE